MTKEEKLYLDACLNSEIESLEKLLESICLDGKQLISCIFGENKKNMSEYSLSNSEKYYKGFVWLEKTINFIYCYIYTDSALASSSLFITQKFKSTSVIYPTTTNSISQALLVEYNPYRKDVLEFGEELEAERLLQILNSDEMQNRIIEQYDLYKHYDINRGAEHARTFMNLAFDDHFSFKRTEFMSIEIDVLDKDPKLASEMCNQIVDLIDVVVLVKQQRAEQSLVILERRDKELSNRLFLLYDSLEILRSHGILDVSVQAERLTEYYAQALVEGNISGARAIKEEFNNLAQYGGAYYRLFEELELVQEQLQIIRLEKKILQLILMENSRIDL